jgi:hypothetical protein
MLLVDTSVWIDLLGREPSFRLEAEQLFQLCICPPIVQELLQGMPHGERFERLRAAVLALPCVPETIAVETYVKAADVYRSGRRRGLTIRSSVDCLIAVIAIERGLPVWHKDRDFDAIASFTELQVTKKPW